MVALSSVEAVFNSMVKGLGKLRWLKRLLEKIGYPSKSTINLYCDYKAVIEISFPCIPFLLNIVIQASNIVDSIFSFLKYLFAYVSKDRHVFHFTNMTKENLLSSTYSW